MLRCVTIFLRLPFGRGRGLCFRPSNESSKTWKLSVPNQINPKWRNNQAFKCTGKQTNEQASRPSTTKQTHKQTNEQAKKEGLHDDS